MSEVKFVLQQSSITHTILWLPDKPYNIRAASWDNLFLSYAYNKGADQLEHPRSLISAFVVRCLDIIIPLLAKYEISKTLTSFCSCVCRFESNVVAQFYLLKRTSAGNATVINHSLLVTGTEKKKKKRLLSKKNKQKNKNKNKHTHNMAIYVHMCTYQASRSALSSQVRRSQY